MKKRLFLLVSLLFVLVMSACSQSEDTSSDGEKKVELTVSSFGGTYDEVFQKYVVDPFVADHPNVTVKIAPYTGVTKLGQGGGNNLDVVQLDDFDLIDAGNNGYLAALEEDKVEHWGDLYPQAFLEGKDGETYGLVNVFGSWGIAYNPNEVDKPESWNDLLDPSLKGKVTLMSQWIPDMLLFAETTGANYETMDSVWQMYTDLTPSVAQYYTSFSAPESLFETGEVYIGSWFDGRANALKAAGKDIDFVIPKEGGALIRSGLGVLESSENKELAQELINYSLKPAAQEGFAKELYYGPTNQTVELEADVQESVVYGDEVDSLIAPDWNEILPHREEWLTKWTEITAQ